MSLLQLPDSPNLQIWNNAAFDDDGSASKLTPLPPPLRPVSTNFGGSPLDLDLDPSKENRSPDPASTPLHARAAAKKPAPAAKPLHATAAPKKPAARVAFSEEAEVDDASIDDEIARVEEEIARLRSRLDALRVRKAEGDARADARQPRGRIVPAKFMDPKLTAARTPATPASKRIEQSPAALATSAGFRRRGLSLGPLEILATPARSLDPKRSAAKNLWPSALKKKMEESPAPSAKVDRRGLSLGPLEIYESFTLDQPDRAKETPLRSVQSCKKPGFQKLKDIAEEKGITEETERSLSPKSRPPATAKKMAPDPKKAAETPANVRLRQRGVSLGPAEIASNTRSRPNNLQDREKGMKVDKSRRRSSSMCPKSQQPSAAKVSELKKWIITMGAKKPAKEDQSLGSIRPKALFQESKSAVSCKRPSKTAKVRVVASRYSLAGNRAATDEPGSKRRKWSLPELGRGKTRGLLRGSSGSMPECKRSQASELEDQMKLDLDMLDNLDVDVNCPSSAQKSPPSIVKVAAMLPKIKTSRCATESPRDSGCAKRAADLIGRKSFFAEGEDEELNSPCQTLTFHDE